MLGCAGAGNSRRLAEIIAGYCLSLDLSTLSAIASGQFATAHEKMGRNRPVEWLKREELDPGFFQRGLRVALEDPSLQVTGLEPIEGLESGSSIITAALANLTGSYVNPWAPYWPELFGDTINKARTLRAPQVRGCARLRVCSQRLRGCKRSVG